MTFDCVWEAYNYCPDPAGDDASSDSAFPEFQCRSDGSIRPYIFENGYCSAICTSDAECGEGAECKKVCSHQRICLKKCVDSSDCRPGYRCLQDMSFYCVPGDFYWVFEV